MKKMATWEVCTDPRVCFLTQQLGQSQAPGASKRACVYSWNKCLLWNANIITWSLLIPFDSVKIHFPPLAEYHTPPTLTRRSWPHKLNEEDKESKETDTYRHLPLLSRLAIKHTIYSVFKMICMGQCFPLQFHSTESWAIVEWESLILCTSSWPL